jgi:Sulfotransferase family
MRFGGPLFLVGMPRSGTKLLRDLLNRHPRIGIPDVETEFLPWLANRFMRFGDLSDLERFHSFYNEIVKQTHFRYRQERDSIVSANDWYAACRTFDAAGVFEALIRLEVGASFDGDRIWGDKSPSYINDLPLLGMLYPTARFVHIVRDVRDYCLSIHKAWGKDMLRAAQRWADDIEAARRAGRTLRGRYAEVRYEDLLQAPVKELRRLCDFIGVSFVDSMTNLERPAENLGDAQGATDIVSQNYGKYLTQMSSQTLARIEAIAGKTLEALGYELSLPRQGPARLSATELRLAQLRDGWNLLWEREGRRPLWALRTHLRYFRTTRG